MRKTIDGITEQLGPRRDFESPPLHLWNPALSGDIAIRIDREGNWYHEGGLIKRESLVRLFASILRREDDGEYYLVTPVEKWRIEVELYPLFVVDIECESKDGSPDQLVATLNTGKEVPIIEDSALFLQPAADNIAALRLEHGLTAIFSRSAWYRFVEMSELSGESLSIKCGDRQWVLAPD